MSHSPQWTFGPSAELYSSKRPSTGLAATIVSLPNTCVNDALSAYSEELLGFVARSATFTAVPLFALDRFCTATRSGVGFLVFSSVRNWENRYLISSIVVNEIDVSTFAPMEETYRPFPFIFSDPCCKPFAHQKRTESAATALSNETTRLRVQSRWSFSNGLESPDESEE